MPIKNKYDYYTIILFVEQRQRLVFRTVVELLTTFLSLLDLWMVNLPKLIVE